MISESKNIIKRVDINPEKKIWSMFENINNAKKRRNIKKKITAKSIKISIGIKTITEENKQNIEESNAKDIEGEKEEQIMNNDYRLPPKNDK